MSESEEGNLIIKNEKAINNPEDIATLLVHAGLPPILLRIEEEDIESYFLRAVGVNGDIK